MATEKYKFSDIFQENPDGSLSLKIGISVNGVFLAPGTTIRSGAVFGGIDFFNYKNLDVAGEYSDDTLLVQGFFKQ